MMINLKTCIFVCVVLDTHGISWAGRTWLHLPGSGVFKLAPGHQGRVWVIKVPNRPHISNSKPVVPKPRSQSHRLQDRCVAFEVLVAVAGSNRSTPAQSIATRVRQHTSELPRVDELPNWTAQGLQCPTPNAENLNCQTDQGLKINLKTHWSSLMVKSLGCIIACNWGKTKWCQIDIVPGAYNQLESAAGNLFIYIFVSICDISKVPSWWPNQSSYHKRPKTQRPTTRLVLFGASMVPSTFWPVTQSYFLCLVRTSECA